MLSNEELRDLGKFKMLMFKIHRQSVKIESFLSDSEYQSEMLDIAEEFNEYNMDDDELIMLSLTLRSRFGRLGAGITAIVAPAVVEIVAEKIPQTTTEPQPDVQNDKKSYFAGLR